jgi:hypothetical protein
MRDNLRSLRIHITPDDFIADIDEYADGSEPRSRCWYFVEPYGPYQINEACDASYYVGNKVPYHEHWTGYETFLVDGGSVEVSSMSRRAVARKGDIVHYAPYVPHMVHFLEDGTIWRAFHQGLQMVQGKIEELRVRDMYPDDFNAPNFKQDVSARLHLAVRYDYMEPECTEVSANEIACIRPYDFALAKFNFDGLELRLKVGRWETGGAREVWQLLLRSGYTLSWAPNNIHPLLFDVFDGSVEVRLDGMDAFTAKTRDILHIPKFLGGSIKTLEDTVLLDCGCQGYLTRYLDELNAYRVREPEKLRKDGFIRDLMKKYEYFILFEGL